MINLSKIDKSTFKQLNPQYKTSDYSLTSGDNVILPLYNLDIYFASLHQTESASVGADFITEVANSSESNSDTFNSSVSESSVLSLDNAESANSPNTKNELDNLITELNAKPPQGE